MTDSALPPAPPAAVVLGGLLRLICRGGERVAVCSPWGPSQTHLALLSSDWMLTIESDAQGRPWRLLAAVPPDPRRQPWTWGCQRDDWRLGPDSVITNPLDQLNANQRERLQRVLMAAPAPQPEPEWFELASDDPEDLILD